MTEFYDNIEEPIRELVRCLRDNGINTVCSCGHEMSVQADIVPDGQLYNIHRTVFNYLAERELPLNYTITTYLEVRDGHPRCFVELKID